MLLGRWRMEQTECQSPWHHFHLIPRERCTAWQPLHYWSKEQRSVDASAFLTAFYGVSERESATVVVLRSSTAVSRLRSTSAPQSPEALIPDKPSVRGQLYTFYWPESTWFIYGRAIPVRSVYCRLLVVAGPATEAITSRT